MLLFRLLVKMFLPKNNWMQIFLVNKKFPRHPVYIYSRISIAHVWIRRTTPTPTSTATSHRMFYLTQKTVEQKRDVLSCAYMCMCIRAFVYVLKQSDPGGIDAEGWTEWPRTSDRFETTSSLAPHPANTFTLYERPYYVQYAK